MKNKKNAHKFKRVAEAAMELWDDQHAIVELLEGVDDPISESADIHKLISEGGDKTRLLRLDEMLHNIWSGRPVERVLGLARRGKLDQEYALADKVLNIIEEMKQWGAPFCWTERIHKNDIVIYKVYGDYPPSKLYLEHQRATDRNVILSPDHANIIQIVYGEHNG